MRLRCDQRQMISIPLNCPARSVSPHIRSGDMGLGMLIIAWPVWPILMGTNGGCLGVDKNWRTIKTSTNWDEADALRNATLHDTPSLDVRIAYRWGAYSVEVCGPEHPR